MYFFVSCLSFFFKSFRLIFVLISFEFLVLYIFLLGSFSFSFLSFVFVIVVSVMSSTLGLIFLVFSLSLYGADLSLF